MKFSTKGWYKVYEEATYFSDDIDDEVLKWDNAKQEYKLRLMEFEPDDFQGCVVITIDEAKEIATLCGEAEFYAMQGENIKAKRLVGKARDLLVKRIEQVEDKDD